MGQSQSFCTEMNMSASPEVGQMIVAKVHRRQGWYKPQISTNFEDGRKPEDLQAGDKIRVNMKKAVFNLTIVGDSSELEKQEFCFTSGEAATDGSIISQKGNFKVSGMNAHLFGPGWNMSVQTRPRSECVSEDLKSVPEKEMN